MLEHTFEEDAVPRVRLFPLEVGIQVHHITRTEVRKEILTLIRNAQCQGVETIIFRALLLLYELQSYENIPNFLLLCQRHIP